MIVVCNLSVYGTQSKKTKELASFLRSYVERRSVPDEASFKIMKMFIRRKLSELNQAYPKSVTVSMKVEYSEKFGGGSIRFMRPNASVAIMCLDVLHVSEFKK